jgi:hypothetical protein
MTTKPPIRIEHGPTPDGQHLVKVDGVLLGEPHGKAGAALEAARNEQARLQALEDNLGVHVTVTRRYFQVTQSKGGKLPEKAKALDELTVAEVSALSIGKLEEAIDTGAYDDDMAELLALEQAKAKPRAGAVALLEAEIAELKADAEAAAKHQAFVDEHAAEVAVLNSEEAPLIASIANGDHDEILDGLTYVEAAIAARQPVLDALSDRSVAKALEDNAAKAAADGADDTDTGEAS